MVPNHHGERVYMVIQQGTRKGWKSVAAYRKKMDTHSRATFPIAYTRRSVINVPFRIVAVFNGDRSNGAVAWGYWYFEITR
jgi:hypothetical protein